MTIDDSYSDNGFPVLLITNNINKHGYKQTNLQVQGRGNYLRQIAFTFLNFHSPSL